MIQTTATATPDTGSMHVGALGAPVLGAQASSRSLKLPSSDWLVQGFWIFALVNISTFLYLPDAPAITSVLVFVRYLLWPAVIAFAATYISIKGVSPILRAFGPFTPYLVVGIISAFASYALIDGLRLLTFWVLIVLAAVLTGLKLSPGTTIRTTYYAIAMMVATSALFSLLVPSLGTSPDIRVSSGFAWRGLFGNKNQLGEICCYTILFSIVARDVKPWWRLTITGLTILVLYKTDSQGAVLNASLVAGYWLLLQMVRRMGLSPVSSTLAILGIIIGGTLFFFAASEPLLYALGRDATLTGRTDIWALWLGRAAQNWVIGAGPGSFTLPYSITTADLALASQGFGAIHTPHNMLIAIFGEVGVIGLICFLVPMIWLMAYVPFRTKGQVSALCSLIAFTTLLTGLTETREVFGIGLNMSMLMLAYGALLRETDEAEDRLVADEAGEPVLFAHTPSSHHSGEHLQVLGAIREPIGSL